MKFRFQSFRPLIRGLSISSDYVFWDYCTEDAFPSPHPGIINFFGAEDETKPGQIKFPSPHPGIINFFRLTGSLKS